MLKPAAATNLIAPNIVHGFFTRAGGVSDGIYDGLNCGFGSDDAASNVRENRHRIARYFDVQPGSLITPHQQHTGIAAIAEQPWRREDAPIADAIVTATKGLVVGVLTADCAPVLFADQSRGIVAAAHAGWRGAKGGIIMATIQQMEKLGASRSNITAAIGPALSLKAYEVGDEFRNEFIEETPDNARFFREATGEKPHFDLLAYVKSKLEELGVTSVEQLQDCTYTSESLFYSYRRSLHKNEGDYGRQISAIMLK